MLSELTISIPTYNRSARLAWLLNEIEQTVPQEVSVAIHNDCSTDDTKTVIEDYVRRTHRRIRHSRNELNQGVDESIRRAVALAETKYVWLMGDDDAFDPAIPSELQRVVQAHPAVGLVYFNYRGWLADLSTPVTQRIIQCERDAFFPSGLELLYFVGGQISFLSAVCFQRDLFVEAASRMPENQKNTAVDHVWPILQVLKTNSAYLLAEPYIKCRTGDEDRGFSALDYIFKICKYFRDEAYPSLGQEKARKIHGMILSGPLLSKMMAYRFSLLAEFPARVRLCQKSIGEFWAQGTTWKRVVPLLLLPGPVVRAIRHRKALRRVKPTDLL